MKAGALLLAISEIVVLLQQQGFITATYDFDDTKFNDIGADLTLVSGVETILKKYGVAIPPKIDEVLQLLPLVARLFVK